MKNIKLFTHTDMDGISPYILLKHFYPNANIDYSFCDYRDINEKVADFIYNDEFLNFDAIYITDISVSEENAEKLQSLFETTDIEIRLFDHHKTALGLNKFEFCKVVIEENDELICGTRLFYNFLVKEKECTSSKTIYNYVKYVNDYDTWLWKNKYNYDLPEKWNSLFFTYGRLDFIRSVLDKFEKNNLSFNEVDKTLLRIRENEKKAYVQTRTKEVFLREIDGHKCAIVFAERFGNEIANKLFELYPECDIQITISQNGLSFRNLGNNNIDLTKIAELFGGGGHAAAAGAPIRKELKSKYLDMILEN